jgi:RNA polymerase sigma factor (sigma-70 family)
VGYLTTTQTASPLLPEARPGGFAVTHWSVVLAAGRSETTHARAALEQLCEIYWYPLYAYVRRRGHSPEDAEDLTQEFFARLLENKWVCRADQEKGRFRSFLLSAMNHFLSDEWDKARAQKRGGGAKLTPLKFDVAETRYGHEAADTITPEQSYERRWALALLERFWCVLAESMIGKAGRSFSPRCTRAWSVAGPVNRMPN